MLPTIHNGIATKNHSAHEGGGFIFWMATTFWGEEMGDAIPPRLDESAMPIIKHEPNVESTGSVRKMGWINEKQRTGAATLLIHMLANVATNMFTNNTRLGFVPALDNTKVAIDLAMPYLLNAPAIANPPNNNMMTGENMAAKTRLVASGAVNRSSFSRITRSMTTKRGTNKAVTNNGITWWWMSIIYHTHTFPFNNSR